MHTGKILILIIVTTSFIYSQQWSRITTTGNVPHFKNHSAIYYPLSNSMIVFGGRNAAGDPTDEMWSLNLSTNQWTKLTPLNVAPFSRYTQNAHYDSLNNRMIIWSGQGASQALFNDVWAYNFSTSLWQQLWPDGNINGVPLKRYGTASVFDPLKRHFVTFAGFSTSGRFEDTWTFNVDSNAWQERTNGIYPPKRCLHAAVFAPDMRKMVMYAGQHDAGPLDDIWTLNMDNYSWQNVTPAFRPPARFWNSTIYSGNAVVIFGGLGASALDDMWKFSTNTNQWEQVSQGTLKPGPRWGHTAVYAEGQDRMIIFGGQGDSLYKDTWQFSNVSVIGIQQINNNIPKNFLLEQNYPNPFNPITNIRFQLSNGGVVRLIVLDVNGREITTLVNDNMEPGVYEIKWDASGFSSGIYFCRMETAGYSDTKKMLLVK
jgi:hypothetical protein